MVHGRSRVREPEDGRHARSSSGTANRDNVREVKFDDDDFMPMPPPRRHPSPENPDDYKREDLFEPLPPPTVRPTTSTSLPFSLVGQAYLCSSRGQFYICFICCVILNQIDGYL